MLRQTLASGLLSAALLGCNAEQRPPIVAVPASSSSTAIISESTTALAVSNPSDLTPPTSASTNKAVSAPSDDKATTTTLVADSEAMATDAGGVTVKRVVIDLASYQEPIKVMLDKSVSDFSREHPDRAVSMLMLSYTGYNPLLVVAVDTPQHSDKHIEEFSSTLFKEFPDFAGRDEHGAFCINASDCEFEIGHFRFQGFPDMYGIGPFSLRYPNGDIVPIDITNRGDVAMDDAMFKFLLPVMEKFNGWRTLKRAPIFRLGIQTEDRSYSKFWRPLE